MQKRIECYVYLVICMAFDKMIHQKMRFHAAQRAFMLVFSIGRVHVNVIVFGSRRPIHTQYAMDGRSVRICPLFISKGRNI